MTLPGVPLTLKGINHFMKVAVEHEQRDPVVAYWARFYGVQKGLEIDKSSPEAKQFLVGMLNWLEKRKKELHDNEAISNESVAEAHLENYAIKLFNWADNQDRQSIFNKNMIKAFYTSGILFDILENFGELNEEFLGMRKYGKWKAAHIHQTLKNGEIPLPGPMQEEEPDTEEGDTGSAGQSHYEQPYVPLMPEKEMQPIPVVVPYSDPMVVVVNNSNLTLSVEQISKAQKYCKFAGSALNFDDISTAITNLEKALRLLKTGQDDDGD